MGLEEEGHRKREQQEQRPGGGTWQGAQEEQPADLCSGACGGEVNTVWLSGDSVPRTQQALRGKREPGSLKAVGSRGGRDSGALS